LNWAQFKKKWLEKPPPPSPPEPTLTFVAPRGTGFWLSEQGIREGRFYWITPDGVVKKLRFEE
jgi:hypothetical protein